MTQDLLNKPKIAAAKPETPNPFELVGKFLTLAAAGTLAGTLAVQPVTAQPVEQAPSTISGKLPANVAPLTIAWALLGKNENLSVQEGYGRTPVKETVDLCGWPAQKGVTIKQSEFDSPLFGQVIAERHIYTDRRIVDQKSKYSLGDKFGNTIACLTYQNGRITGFSNRPGLILTGYNRVNVVDTNNVVFVPLPKPIPMGQVVNLPFAELQSDANYRVDPIFRICEPSEIYLPVPQRQFRRR